MIDIVYDGSFDGFLCALGAALGRADEPRIVSARERAPDLFATELPLPTSMTDADRVRDRLLSVAGEDELKTLLLVHSSAAADRHQLLLAYVRATFDAGSAIGTRMGLPLVCAVQKIRGRVCWEIGKLLGFVRFRRVAEALWYAAVSPDADLVGFIGPHFSDRFPDEGFLIHDLPREIGYVSLRGSGRLVGLEDLPPEARAALADDQEPEVESQWREYFARISVTERRNPRLQERNMPRRYWRHLVERPGVSRS
jgi:probable DNA metabolism protein